jgi:hypothetical protein
MSVKCTHCYLSIKMDNQVNHRGKGLGVEIQCPHCQAWLGRSRILSGLKLVGFYGAVIAGVMGYFLELDTRLVSVAMILSAIVLGVSHLMDHLLVTQAPQISSAKALQQVSERKRQSRDAKP